MKKYLAIVFSIFPLLAHAEPYQTAAESRPYVCKNGMSAFKAAEQNYASKDAAYSMVKSGECRVITSETKFRVIEKTKTKDYYYYQIQLIDEPQAEESLYVSGSVNAPQDPEAALAAHQAELNKLPIGCTTPTGGQVNRLERGKDGQVYMKRYIITSKCVDGQMRSFTKPID